MSTSRRMVGNWDVEMDVRLACRVSKSLEIALLVRIFGRNSTLADQQI